MIDEDRTLLKHGLMESRPPPSSGCGRLLGSFAWEQKFRLLFLIMGLFALAKLCSRALIPKGDHMLYYEAARAFWIVGDPYVVMGGGAEIYWYPPFLAFALMPVTAGGGVAFSALWAVVLGASWWFGRQSIRAIMSQNGAVTPDWLHVLPSIILLRPINDAWGRGQVSMVFLLVLTIAIQRNLEGRWPWASFLIAVASAIKMYPIILGVIFLSPIRPRAIGMLVLLAGLLTTMPALWTGASGFHAIVTNGFLGSARGALEHQVVTVIRCGPVSLAWRLLGLQGGFGFELASGLWALLVFLSVVATRPTQLGCSKLSSQLWLAFTVTSMVIVVPALAEDAFVTLLFPLTISLHVIADGAATTAVRRAALWGVVAFVGLYGVFLPLLVPSSFLNCIRTLGLPGIAITLYWVSLLVAVCALKSIKTHEPVWLTQDAVSSRMPESRDLPQHHGR